MRFRPFLLACPASLLIAGLFSPRAALASSFTFAPSSFGVGTNFTFNCSPCGVDPITGTNFQSGIVMTSASGGTENPNGSYTLQANLNDLNHGGLPTVGALLTNTSNGGVALIADGFSMTGASAIANYTITGNFTITNPPSNDTGVTIKVASYSDFLNCKNTPGCTSPPLGVGAAAAVDIEVVNTPIFKVFFSDGTFTPFMPWTGSYTLKVPVMQSDNGFVLSISGDASGDPPAVTDFLHTTTASFTPSPGGIVTLATGQVFTSTVPEPSSLLLFSAGLIGGIGAMRRKVTK